MAEVPILPPEESQRMGYPVIAALEARVAEARAVAERLRREEAGSTVHAITGGMAAAYEDALELVRAAHRAYGGD